MENIERLEAVSVIVRGRVQGVAFRASTHSQAERLGISGYVQNCPDGHSVEILAEGKKSDLVRLIEYLRVGPPGARVEDVEIRWMTSSGRYTEFSIK